MMERSGVSRWTDKLKAAQGLLSRLERIQRPNSYELAEIAALRWLIPLGEADIERRRREHAYAYSPTVSEVSSDECD